MYRQATGPKILKDWLKLFMTGYSQRMADAIVAKRSPLVVGLDPRLESLPQIVASSLGSDLQQQAQAYVQFCHGVIDAVADIVPAVKPQFAFFEELGPHGMLALKSVTQYATSKGLLVVGDGKRGDIGSTAIAYASAYLGQKSPWGMDCLTVNPYMGSDSLQPMVDIARHRDAGLFFLVKTSNPGSGDLQDQHCQQGTIYQHVAKLVHGLCLQEDARTGPDGLTEIGAVVGATYPQQLEELRKAMPKAWILIPGFGAQGGTASDTAAGFLPSGLGAIVNSSRGVIFAFDKSDTSANWTQAVRAAAVKATEQLRCDTAAGNL